MKRVKLRHKNTEYKVAYYGLTEALPDSKEGDLAICGFNNTLVVWSKKWLRMATVEEEERGIFRVVEQVCPTCQRAF